MMLAHGFTIADMVELVRAGLASATAKRVVAGSRTMEVVTVRITDAGRRAPEKAVVRDKAHHGVRDGRDRVVGQGIA
jgi:hypothetical protein